MFLTIKKSIKKACFLYIDLRFFNCNNFSSKEKTEVLLKEAFYAVTNENEYNELKEIILKFNNYSNMIPKIEKLVNYFSKQNRKILLILDHINFKFSEELKNKTKVKSDKSHIIKIFSLEEFEIQKIFLEEIEKKPKERDYLVIINYPHIKELPKEYSIFGKNPYYYGLKETNNNLLINSLYNNERIKNNKK